MDMQEYWAQQRERAETLEPGDRISAKFNGIWTEVVVGDGKRGIIKDVYGKPPRFDILGWSPDGSTFYHVCPKSGWKILEKKGQPA